MQNNTLKSIFSCSIGNVLEWYDFGLFAIFAPTFTQLFFPSFDQRLALLTTFSIFSIGFLCRPIGALIFGYLGDKKGRAVTLRLSVLMISLPTILIGCIPSYNVIGIWAPIALTVIRIWQGITVGGEYSGNVIYLAETAPSKYRATITSLACSGANIGIILAMVIGNLIAYFSENLHWTWRLAYLFSGIISLIIYFTRLKLQETNVFTHLKQENLLLRNPVWTTFTTNFSDVMRTLGLVCMGSTFYYFCFIFLPVFLTQQLNFPMINMSRFMIFFMLIMVVLTPLVGMIADKIGRRKLLLFNTIFITLIIVPSFYFLQNAHTEVIFLVMVVLTIASSLEQGVTGVVLVEHFPATARYTGLSLGYNFGNGIFGGTVPVICTWVTSLFDFKLAPAFYIAICAMITGVVAYFFVSETANKNLA